MFEAIVLWLHILAAVVFVGPQVFLVAVALPALRTIEDVRVRQRVISSVTRGFGSLGGAALGVLVVTGLYNYMKASDNGFLDYKRYFITLQIKLTLVAVVVVLTILHGAVLGRRLQRLQTEGASEADLAQARQWSMIASIATLAASIAILLCAAILGSIWSKMGGIR